MNIQKAHLSSVRTFTNTLIDTYYFAPKIFDQSHAHTEPYIAGCQEVKIRFSKQLSKNFPSSPPLPS